MKSAFIFPLAQASTIPVGVPCSYDIIDIQNGCAVARVSRGPTTTYEIVRVPRKVRASDPPPPGSALAGYSTEEAAVDALTKWATAQAPPNPPKTKRARRRRLKAADQIEFVFE